MPTNTKTLQLHNVTKLCTNITIPNFTRLVFNVFDKSKTALLLVSTSGVLFQSMLPLKDIEFMPKDVVNALGSARMSSVLKLQLISFLANNYHKK